MKKLKEIRINKGYSMRQLVACSRIPYSTLADFENGKIKRMNEERLERVANLLNCTITDMLEEVEIKVNRKLKCLNENCRLNKNKLCISPIVLADKAPCYGKDRVQSRQPDFDVNTKMLFWDRL